MPLEIVKQRKSAIPRYVLAYFEDDSCTNIVTRDKIVNQDEVRKFLQDPSIEKKVEATFIVDDDGKKTEVNYEGILLGADGKFYFIIAAYFNYCCYFSLTHAFPDSRNAEEIQLKFG